MTWTIPVSLGVPDAAPSAAQHVLLGAQPVTVKMGNCTAPEKANLGEDGYYRTEYDAAGLASLGQNFSTMPPTDRANLMATSSRYMSPPARR